MIIALVIIMCKLNKVDSQTHVLVFVWLSVYSAVVCINCAIQSSSSHQTDIQNSR